MEVESAIDEVAAARDAGRLEEALAIAEGLVKEHPDDARANLQCAWTLDRLGQESPAVEYYRRAIDLGLEDEEARPALLGLGSTLRALGRYDEAVDVLDGAVDRFPQHRPLRVFRALARYNTGRYKEATEELIRLLVESTGDEEISRYEAALDLYASDLDRTWS